MKKVLFALAALVLLQVFATNAHAQETRGITTVCDNGPAMYRYDLPRDSESGLVTAIGQTNSLELPDPEATLQPVGDPICLAATSEAADVHLLQVGYGPGLEFPTRAAAEAAAKVILTEVNRAIDDIHDHFVDAEKSS